MKDAISRQDVWIKLTNGAYTGETTEQFIDRIAKEIESAPPVTPQQRWIPISERLPDDRDWYLAVFKEKGTCFRLIPRVADYIGNGENKWRIIDEDAFNLEYLDLLECIAWMPLPEPYEPQESEEA